MGDHEVDVGRPHQFGGHDQVALVLAILVVDDDDHAAVADFFQQFGDWSKGHRVRRSWFDRLTTNGDEPSALEKSVRPEPVEG